MNLAKIIAKKFYSESLKAFQIERYIFLGIFTEKRRFPDSYTMNAIPDPGPGPGFRLQRFTLSKNALHMVDTIRAPTTLLEQKKSTWSMILSPAEHNVKGQLPSF